MLTLLLGAAVAAAAPTPTASPLKTITHVRSSPFCSALHENVGRSVEALIENNVAFGGAKALFFKMARDEVSGASPGMLIDMDMQQLDPYIRTVAENLQRAQELLNGSERFEPKPGTEDARRLAQIQAQLRAIIARQNDALNILSGTFFSYEGNRLQGLGDPLAGAIAAVNEAKTTPADDDVPPPIVVPPTRSDASPAPSPSAAVGPEVPVRDLGLIDSSRFAGLFNGLTTYQVQEKPLETQAAKTILDAARQCTGGKP